MRARSPRPPAPQQGGDARGGGRRRSERARHVCGHGTRTPACLVWTFPLPHAAPFAAAEAGRDRCLGSQALDLTNFPLLPPITYTTEVKHTPSQRPSPASSHSSHAVRRGRREADAGGEGGGQGDRARAGGGGDRDHAGLLPAPLPHVPPGAFVGVYGLWCTGWGGVGGKGWHGTVVCVWPGGRREGPRRGGGQQQPSPQPNPLTHHTHPTHQPRHGPTTKQVRELFNKRNQTPAGPRGEDDEGYSAAGATPPRPAVGAQPRCVCVCSGWCGGLVGGLTPLDRTALPSTCVSPSIDPSTGTHAHTHSLPPTTHRPMEPTPHIGRWPTRCMRTRPTSRTWAR